LARRALHEWRVEDVSDPVVLVVSELVTNALVHGHGRAWLEIRRNHAGIRVMVTDSTSPLPQARQLDPEATSGRGLRLVQALTHSWGTEPSPCGKTVWAQVAK
jgi:two-component sensor histidine kinase